MDDVPVYNKELKRQDNKRSDDAILRALKLNIQTLTSIGQEYKYTVLLPKYFA